MESRTIYSRSVSSLATPTPRSIIPVGYVASSVIAEILTDSVSTVGESGQRKLEPRERDVMPQISGFPLNFSRIEWFL